MSRVRTSAPLARGAPGAVPSDPMAQMAEAAPFGVAQSNQEGELVYVNDAWRRITGVTDPLPLAPRVPIQIVHPDERDEVMKAYARSIADRTTIETRTRFLRPDGTVVHVRVQGTPLSADDGSPAGYVGTVVDVTPYVESLDARRWSDERYRNLMARSPIGQVVYDLTGTLVETNQAGAELVGYQPDELVGVSAIDFLIGEERDVLLAQLHDLVEGATSSVHLEHRLRHRDGRELWVDNQITLERSSDGTPVNFHALTIDITEGRAAAELLRSSEAYYRKLIDDSPVGQLISRIDGELVEVNPAFLRMLGMTSADLGGRGPIDLLHPDDAVIYLQEIGRLLKGEISAVEREGRLLHSDGSIIWANGSTSLIRDGDEVLLHAIMTDISERKQAEARLAESEEQASAVIASLHEGLIIYTRDEVLLANDSASRILDIPRDELVGPLRRLARIETTDSEENPVGPGHRSVYRSLVEGVAQNDVIRGYRDTSGHMRWCLLNAIPLFHEGQSEPYAGVLSLSEITDRKEATDALAKSEDRFRSLAESLPVAIFQCDSQGLIGYVNPQWTAVTGRVDEPGDLEEMLSMVHPDDVRLVRAGMDRVLGKGRSYHDQFRITEADGSVRWHSARAEATRADDGHINGMIGSVEDITSLVAAQEQNGRLAGIVESTSDLVGIADPTTGRLIYVNRTARDAFGLAGKDLTSVNAFKLYSRECTDLYLRQILPTLERGETWTGELTMIAADGTEMETFQSIIPTMLADGTLHQISTIGRDVTEKRRHEKDLAHRATHDSLTGLPNRLMLLDRLGVALSRAKRDGSLIAVLFLDLDHFKQVNDTKGHDAGDQLLAQAARRIAAVVRPSDTVARLGGDEFVILCDDVVDQAQATAVARRVAAAIDDRPFRCGNLEVSVSASIGISLSAAGDAFPEALLRDADAAMYRAKDLGRARLEIYDESMRRTTAHRNELTERLAAGIEGGEISVQFQPCVDLVTGRVSSVEALARWDHPDFGELSPHGFISLAEETGLIVGLGLRVLSVGCEQARRWEHRFGSNAPTVHVNLSARQLSTPSLAVLVQGVLEGSGLTPDRLCLEITESVLMEDAQSVIATLADLKAIGVSLAIDDFGTGYSSLSYLRRFPVDVLKIDQSFIAGLGPNPEDSTIVTAVVSLARTLDLKAIAEGVETLDQVRLLQDLGCELAQGFYFSAPVDADAVASMIEAGFTV